MEGTIIMNGFFWWKNFGGFYKDVRSLFSTPVAKAGNEISASKFAFTIAGTVEPICVIARASERGPIIAVTNTAPANRIQGKFVQNFLVKNF